MFQLKDFTSIVASMINHMRGNTKKITDFQPGSVARTLVEAPAVEIEELYLKMFQGLVEAIPVATYTSFDFSLLPASSSSGVLTFYALNGHSSTITIPAGTSARNSATDQTYVTTRAATIAVGQTQVSIPARAEAIGFIGNADANTITKMVDNITGVSGVANLTAFVGGRDTENEDERKQRFREYISTLQRGTIAALYYGAKTATVRDANGVIIESVALINHVEPYAVDPVANNPGLVLLYVHNGVGGTSPSLVTEAQRIIDGYYLADGTPVPGYKAAGVEVNVFSAAEVALNVTGTVEFLPGYDVDQQADILASCVTAVRDYLLSLPIGAKAVHAEIIERIMTVEGVYNVALTAPVADTTVSSSQKIVPGVVDLT